MTIDQLKEEVIELVEEYFPKGKCKERGQAMVLVAQILVLIGKEKDRAYEAFWNIAEVNDQYLRGLEIEVVKVNPETKEVDDDESKNTEVNYWLETGLFNGEAWEHDIELDCGGSTFEEAIVNLWEKINAKSTD